MDGTDNLNKIRCEPIWFYIALAMIAFLCALAAEQNSWLPWPPCWFLSLLTLIVNTAWSTEKGKVRGYTPFLFTVIVCLFCLQCGKAMHCMLFTLVYFWMAWLLRQKWNCVLFMQNREQKSSVLVTSGNWNCLLSTEIGCIQQSNIDYCPIQRTEIVFAEKGSCVLPYFKNWNGVLSKTAIVCVVENWNCLLSKTEIVCCRKLKLFVVENWNCVLSQTEIVCCRKLRLWVAENWDCELSKTEIVSCRKLRLCVV